VNASHLVPFDPSRWLQPIEVQVCVPEPQVSVHGSVRTATASEVLPPQPECWLKEPEKRVFQPGQERITIVRLQVHARS
jgi:hypothetical protein